MEARKIALRENVQRPALITIKLVVAGFLFVASSANAQSASTQMRVSVQVVARAIATVTSQPVDVDVTAADVERGFVDASAPILIHGRTNSRAGYRLSVSNSDPAFASVTLAFGESSMNVVSEGWITRPYIPGGETVAMTARLQLAPGLKPGRYRMPLVVSASPL